MNYCWSDGTKLIEKPDPKCPSCGKNKIGKYCAYCGNKFTKNKEKG